MPYPKDIPSDVFEAQLHNENVYDAIFEANEGTNNNDTEIEEGEKKQIVDVISAQAVLKGLSEQRAFFQSLDDCNDQDLNALRWLESRALKQIEKSTALKQLQISNLFSPI